MNKYIKFISPFVFLITLILLISFRSLPSGKLWNEYNVLYVPVAADDSKVLYSLEECQIRDTVCLSQQFLPLALNENSIELSLLRLNYGSPDFDYSSRRKAFFFDKADLYRLYYIPTQYKSKLNEAVQLIESYGIPCGTDTSASYPWLLPLINLLLALMLFLFVKNKLIFALSCILPLLFLYCNPFYPVATACCLSLLCLFFLANVWRRKDAGKVLIKNPFITLMLLAALISSFSGLIESGFLFILTFAGNISLFIMIDEAENWIRNKKAFVPVFIRPARRVSIFAGKALLIMGISSGAVLFILALFFLTSTNTLKAKNEKLQLPASTSVKNEKLPQFEDYFRWCWNVETAPYKSLNSNYSENPDYVEFNTYSENPDTGLISQETKTLTYNDSYRQEIYDGISALKFNSIEKVMKSQGDNLTFGYSAIRPDHLNLFGIIMMFICLFILLFIYICIIIRKGINK